MCWDGRFHLSAAPKLTGAPGRKSFLMFWAAVLTFMILSSLIRLAMTSFPMFSLCQSCATNLIRSPKLLIIFKLPGDVEEEIQLQTLQRPQSSPSLQAGMPYMHEDGESCGSTADLLSSLQSFSLSFDGVEDLQRWLSETSSVREVRGVNYDHDDDAC